MRIIRSLGSFLKRMFKGFIKGVFGILKEIVVNVDTVILCTFAGFGCATFLADLPFQIALPIWIESSMFIPVFSVVIIMTLIMVMELRERHASSIA